MPGPIVTSGAILPIYYVTAQGTRTIILPNSGAGASGDVQPVLGASGADTGARANAPIHPWQVGGPSHPYHYATPLTPGGAIPHPYYEKVAAQWEAEEQAIHNSRQYVKRRNRRAAAQGGATGDSGASGAAAGSAPCLTRARYNLRGVPTSPVFPNPWTRRHQGRSIGPDRTTGRANPPTFSLRYVRDHTLPENDVSRWNTIGNSVDNIASSIALRMKFEIVHDTNGVSMPNREIDLLPVNTDGTVSTSRGWSIGSANALESWIQGEPIYVNNGINTAEARDPNGDWYNSRNAQPLRWTGNGNTPSAFAATAGGFSDYELWVTGARRRPAIDPITGLEDSSRGYLVSLTVENRRRYTTEDGLYPNDCLGILRNGMRHFTPPPGDPSTWPAFVAQTYGPVENGALSYQTNLQGVYTLGSGSPQAVYTPEYIWVNHKNANRGTSRQRAYWYMITSHGRLDEDTVQQGDDIDEIITRPDQPHFPWSFVPPAPVYDAQPLPWEPVDTDRYKLFPRTIRIGALGTGRTQENPLNRYDLDLDKLGIEFYFLHTRTGSDSRFTLKYAVVTQYGGGPTGFTPSRVNARFTFRSARAICQALIGRPISIGDPLQPIPKDNHGHKSRRITLWITEARVRQAVRKQNRINEPLFASAAQYGFYFDSLPGAEVEIVLATSRDPEYNSQNIFGWDAANTPTLFGDKGRITTGDLGDEEILSLFTTDFFFVTQFGRTDADGYVQPAAEISPIPNPVPHKDKVIPNVRPTNSQTPLPVFYRDLSSPWAHWEEREIDRLNPLQGVHLEGDYYGVENVELKEGHIYWTIMGSDYGLTGGQYITADRPWGRMIFNGIHTSVPGIGLSTLTTYGIIDNMLSQPVARRRASDGRYLPFWIESALQWPQAAPTAPSESGANPLTNYYHPGGWNILFGHPVILSNDPSNVVNPNGLFQYGDPAFITNFEGARMIRRQFPAVANDNPLGYTNTDMITASTVVLPIGTGTFRYYVDQCAMGTSSEWYIITKFEREDSDNVQQIEENRFAVPTVVYSTQWDGATIPDPQPPESLVNKVEVTNEQTGTLRLKGLQNDRGYTLSLNVIQNLIGGALKTSTGGTNNLPSTIKTTVIPPDVEDIDEPTETMEEAEEELSKVVTPPTEEETVVTPGQEVIEIDTGEVTPIPEGTARIIVEILDIELSGNLLDVQDDGTVVHGRGREYITFRVLSNNGHLFVNTINETRAIAPVIVQIDGVLYLTSRVGTNADGEYVVEVRR